MQESKIVQIQALIDKAQLSALILWRPDEMVMALGYQPYLGLSLAVFYESGKSVLYVPEKEPKHILPTNIEICEIPWGMQDKPWDICFEHIKSLLSKQSNPKPLGFIKYIGHSAPTSLTAEMPPLPNDFISRLENLSSGGYKCVDEEICKLYTIKDAGAIEGIRRANQVARIGIEAFYKSLEVGNTEVDVKIAIESAITRTMNEKDIYYARGWAQVQAGKNSEYAGTFNITTHNTLKEGDLVMLELGVCVNGYWCDISRTGMVGAISEEAKRKYQVVVDAQKAALAKVKHGVKNTEVYHAAMAVIKENGLGEYFNHELGHGVGYRYHDPQPPLAPYSGETTLEAGMIVTIEPGIYGDRIGGGIRVEDNILVTKDGYELLSIIPRGLKGDET